MKGVEGGRSGDGYKGCKREVRGMMVVKGVEGDMGRRVQGLQERGKGLDSCERGGGGRSAEGRKGCKREVVI